MKGRHPGKGSKPSRFQSQSGRGKPEGRPSHGRPQRGPGSAPAKHRGPDRHPPRGQHRSGEASAEFRPGGKDRWVVGIHSCMETLKVRPRKVRELWLREDYQDVHSLREIAELAEANSITLRSRSAGQLDAVGSGNQGVALAVTESPELDWTQLGDPASKIVLILDGIEDPHNLGSMLRTAWLTGVSGVLIPEDRAVGLTPSVCKVASGGAEHVPVESFSSLPSAIQDLKDAGFWVYGLSEKGTGKPWDFKLPEKVAWVVGSEGSGMRITTERACDELVRVPQVSTGSSYNAAVAMAMALVETCRQFGKPE